MKTERIRLSKLMSEQDICSRREADRLISAGLVMVDGQVVSELGTKVSPFSRITLKQKAKNRQREKVTILLNKPVGFVSCQPEKGYREALELLTEKNFFRKKEGKSFDPSHLKGLGVAGRLDIDSKGLLVFSQDGVLVKKIIGGQSEIEKEYLVRFEGVLTRDKLAMLRQGLSLDGKRLKPAVVDVLQPNVFRFVLQEGKKRQIRRMCEKVKLKVVSLKRVRIGNILLGNLPEGKWCYL